MGGVGVVAALVRRRNAGWTPLLLSAALMLALDPTAIVTDVGFRLSFAAVIGMRAFGKSFAHYLRWLPEAFGVRGACAETLSATIATLPIELRDFGTLPIAALPVNMLIVPVVPFATAVGAATLLLGSLWTPFGLPTALITTVATKAMRYVAATGAALAPAAHVQATTGESLAMTAFLLLLWFALARQEHKRKEDGPPPRTAVSHNRQKT
jgi:predicted membrane metal-binding protein